MLVFYELINLLLEFLVQRSQARNPSIDLPIQLLLVGDGVLQLEVSLERLVNHRGSRCLNQVMNTGFETHIFTIKGLVLYLSDLDLIS